MQHQYFPNPVSFGMLTDLYKPSFQGKYTDQTLETIKFFEMRTGTEAQIVAIDYAAGKYKNLYGELIFFTAGNDLYVIATDDLDAGNPELLQRNYKDQKDLLRHFNLFRGYRGFTYVDTLPHSEEVIIPSNPLSYR